MVKTYTIKKVKHNLDKKIWYILTGPDGHEFPFTSKTSMLNKLGLLTILPKGALDSGKVVINIEGLGSNGNTSK